MAGGVVALIVRSIWAWHAGDVTAAMIVAIVVISIVSFARGSRSAFWIGFVVVGWGWLAISLGTSLGPDLPGTGWIDAIHGSVYRDQAPPSPFDYKGRDNRRRSELDRDAFRTAAHCLVSLALGCLGGVATRMVFAIEDPDREDWVAPDGSLFRPNRRDDGDSP